MAEDIESASAEDTSGFGQAFAHLREGRGDVLDGVGQEEDDVSDDEDRHGVVQRQKGVDVIPKEHDADDKDDAGEHFREKALRFKNLAALFMSSYSKHDECPQYGAESCAGNAKEEAVSDGGEGIILRLAEKFSVVRKSEITCRESETAQLDERGGNDGEVGDGNG